MSIPMFVPSRPFRLAPEDAAAVLRWTIAGDLELLHVKPGRKSRLRIPAGRAKAIARALAALGAKSERALRRLKQRRSSR